MGEKEQEDICKRIGLDKTDFYESDESMSFVFATPPSHKVDLPHDLSWENREVQMHRVDREIMWGNTKKSGIYTTHPKHFGENFRGTDWHWYDVNDCWCFADEWLGKPVKVDVYGAGDEAEFVLNGKSLRRKPIEKLDSFYGHSQ